MTTGFNEKSSKERYWRARVWLRRVWLGVWKLEVREGASDTVCDSGDTLPSASFLAVLLGSRPLEWSISRFWWVFLQPGPQLQWLVHGSPF